VVDQVYAKLEATHGSDFEPLLEKTAYLEKIRVKTVPWKVDPRDEKKYWSTISQDIKKNSLAEDKEILNKELVKRILNRYAEEILAEFKPKTYKFAVRFLTKFYRRILNTFTGKGNRFYWGSKRDLYDSLILNGNIHETRELFKKGTVVVVPTHFSNLDSVMMGYILDRMTGLPSFAYAAGLNLYDYELLAFFMNRLGAYRVDRRKKNPIYLECLKAVTRISLQEGVNNIFFPGGTRSRKGSIEKKLKLGLLGSVIEAQRANYQEGSNKKIFIVPMVAGYPFVLEAKSLINQFLRSSGKEKYIHTRDQLSPIKKTIRFFKHMYGRSSKIYMTLGEPMDVLGNKVDADGQSLDVKGEHIELKKYFFNTENEVVENSQRETVYTKILGDKILDSYLSNNLVLAPHLIAYLVFQHIAQSYKDLSIFNILNLNTKDVFVPYSDIVSLVNQAKKILVNWEENGVLQVEKSILQSPEEIIAQGIREVGVFHPQKTLYMDNHGNVKTEDLKLLYYYHNRMRGYDLQEYLNWTFESLEELKIKTN
jgi:glycerol-3-phosphate O-acyltransferase